MEWPTNEQCYAAMKELAEYYMEGGQLEYWEMSIKQGELEGHFPPGKGFLHDLDQAIRVSSKPAMKDKSELYQLICTVCI
ncbi:hypothetical protein ACJJIK_09110 [Microbulbifer sp. ZKSA006]|uniref:hypothetical protein n=1 Tax=Microbulbifer sp. ZKSA006 TaxID=3243390 RepID=UPI0040394955